MVELKFLSYEIVFHSCENYFHINELPFHLSEQQFVFHETRFHSNDFIFQLQFQILISAYNSLSVNWKLPSFLLVGQFTKSWQTFLITWHRIRTLKLMKKF